MYLMDIDQIKDKLDLDSKELFLIAGSVITGLIHLYVGYTADSRMLILAGLGFLGGTALFMKDLYRNLIVLASIPYTGSQFVFYYLYYGLNLGPLAAFDKIVQLLFIVAGTVYLKDRYSDSESIMDFLKS